MSTLKSLLIAALAVFVLVSATGLMTASSAQGSKPPQDVSVVNTPTVNAQQAGPWSVEAQLAPGGAVGISGTPAVSISGTPTVNVASLPALSLSVQPAFPALPYDASANLTAAAPEAVFGVAAETVGLSTITITNFEHAEVQVTVSRPIMASPDTCVGPVVGGTTPTFLLLLQARSSLHLEYPSPLVFPFIDGASCIRVGASGLSSGTVRISVNGFRQS
jgi:hypothetical protein